MDATVKEKLMGLGVEVDEALHRLMDSEDLYVAVLKQFRDDSNLERLDRALSQGDVREAFEAAHTLKGVISNLGMEGMMKQLHPVVETLRSGSMDGVADMLPDLRQIYDETKEIIKEL